MLVKISSYELYKKYGLPLHFREILFYALVVPFHVAALHVRLLTFSYFFPSPPGEVGGSCAKGPCTRRNRSFKSDSYRKEKEGGLEENGYKSLFYWRWLY